MKPVIVIGKRHVTPAEHDALHTIGYALHHLGVTLHTTASPGAPAAVIEGFRHAGGEPTIHTTGLANVDGNTVCLLDQALAEKLDEKMPDWENQDWFVLHDERDITIAAGLLVGVLEATDRSMVA